MAETFLENNVHVQSIYYFLCRHWMHQWHLEYSDERSHKSEEFGGKPSLEKGTKFEYKLNRDNFTLRDFCFAKKGSFLRLSLVRLLSFGLGSEMKLWSVPLGLVIWKNGAVSGRTQMDCTEEK